MEIVVKLLFWLHLTALAMSGVATFGIPVVGSKFPTATAETRPLLFSIAKGLSRVSQIALGILLVTGPLMLWLDGGLMSVISGNWWFWLKMALVLILLIGVIYSGMNARKAEAGDMAAAQLQPRIGAVLMVVLLGVILSAVFTFE